MINRVFFTLFAVVLLLVFLGCSKERPAPTELPKAPTPPPETVPTPAPDGSGQESIDAVGEDISDIDTVEEDLGLDLDDLDTVLSDIENI